MKTFKDKREWDGDMIPRAGVVQSAVTCLFIGLDLVLGNKIIALDKDTDEIVSFIGEDNGETKEVFRCKFTPYSTRNALNWIFEGEFELKVNVVSTILKNARSRSIGREEV